MTEKNIVDFDEDEETEDEGFTCYECDTPLIEDITGVQPGSEASGYGCPECMMPHCPFCQKSLAQECEHEINLTSDFFGEDYPPFNDQKELQETLEKFMPRLKQVLEKYDWSEEQKKQAFGTLSSAYETFASNIKGTHNLLSAIYNALPDTSGIACSRYSTDMVSYTGGTYYGLWCEKRDDYMTYWTEQATSFITSLEKLVLMEPKTSR